MSTEGSLRNRISPTVAGGAPNTASSGSASSSSQLPPLQSLGGSSSSLTAAALAAASSPSAPPASSSSHHHHHHQYHQQLPYPTDHADDDDDSGGVGGSSGSSFVIEPLEWRDTYRHIFSNLPCAFFHTFSLLVTFFLLLIALADRTSILTSWYMLLEGLMVVFFSFEIVSRWILFRGGSASFFQNRANLAEAVLCLVCVIAFFTLFSARAARRGLPDEAPAMLHQRDGSGAAAQKRETTEHELIVIVRFLAQMFRGWIYLRNVLRARSQSQQGGGGVGSGGMMMGGGGGGGGISIMHTVPSVGPVTQL